MTHHDIPTVEAQAFDRMEREATVAPFLQAGTWSHGTLRDEDMLTMFDTIGGMMKCEWCVATVKHTRRLLAWINEHEDEEDPCVCSQCLRTLGNWRDTVSEDIQYLFDHVGEHHTPEGFYFGAIEGDASDFGVWPAQREYSVTFNLYAEGYADEMEVSNAIKSALNTYRDNVDGGWSWDRLEVDVL